MTPAKDTVAAQAPRRTNVLGGGLASCCPDNSAGFARDGLCRHTDHDPGMHVVCAQVTQAFLDFSRARGNDLVTPRPEMRFPGLRAGDRWCLCASRWLEADRHEVAPPVLLDATDAAALKIIPLERLRAHAAEAGPAPAAGPPAGPPAESRRGQPT